MAEDLVQYALEVAECYPINKMFAGFIDYKRARWLCVRLASFHKRSFSMRKRQPKTFRDTLQQSQLPIDADFVNSRSGKSERLLAGFSPHLIVELLARALLYAITTTAFIQSYYPVAATGPSARSPSTAPGIPRTGAAIPILIVGHLLQQSCALVQLVDASQLPRLIPVPLTNYEGTDGAPTLS